jgi:hypothetical protein
LHRRERRERRARPADLGALLKAGRSPLPGARKNELSFTPVKNDAEKLNPADSSVDSHHVNPPNARTGLNDVIINPVELNILIGGK